MCDHNFQNGQCTKCGKYDFAGTFSQVYSDDALEDSAEWQAELAEVRAEMLANAGLALDEYERSLAAEAWYE